MKLHCLLAACATYLSIHTGALAVPIVINFDASFEGLADHNQNSLKAGVIEVGWLNTGVTEAQIRGFFAAGDFAAVDAAFNQVFTITFSAGSANSFGDGLIFESVTVVADGDTVGVTAYKGAATGPAGRTMLTWIRNAAALNATEQAFVRSPNFFPTANDIIGFTDWSEGFGTDSFSVTAADVWAGSLATVLTGSGVDTNGGSPVDGKGKNDGTKVLVTASIATATTATLNFSAGTKTVVENAGTVTVTVNRSGKVDNTVTVNFATADGSALAGTDYTATSGLLTFGPNVRSQDIVVTVANPAGFQGERSFGVTISNPLPAAEAELGTLATIAVTIQDDETAMSGALQLSAATYSAAENAGPVAVIVRRVGGSDGAVSATIATANGSASSPADYTAISQAVNFAAGDAADKTINIALNDDTTFEGNETFSVALTAPTGGATLGTPSSATVTITENDAPPTAGSISFTSATFSGAENGGSITIRATRSGGTTGAVSVQAATSDGTAIAPGDYTTTSSTLSWATGESGEKTFTVPVVNNSSDEADKKFNVALSAPAGGASVASPSTAEVTIVDDDTAGTFAFAATTATVAETAGQVTLTINRTLGTAGAVDLLVNTAAGPAPAAAAGDFEALTNKVVTFANGQTSATVSIGIADNTAFTGSRNFQATLSTGGGPAIIGANATATVTVTDNDTPLPGRFSFDAASYSAAEGTPTVTVTVIRTDGSDHEVKVTYTAVNGTAKAPGDFLATTGQLTFVQGDVSETFTVPINDDTLAEPTETFTVKLSSPTNGAKLGVRTTATIRVADNEPTYRLDSATYAVTEGSAASVKVLRINGLSVPRSVSYRITNGSAVAGRDFAGASGTLLFDANVAEQTITIPIFDDATPEGAETFKVSLVKINPSDLQVGLSSPSTATVTIARSDATEQPDLTVSGGSGFVGSGVINASGSGQSAVRVVNGSQAATFTARVTNAGDAPDSIVVTGVAGGSVTSGVVRITRNGSDITSSVLGTNGFTLSNVPAKASVELKVSVKVTSGGQFAGYGVTLTGTSAATSGKTDTIKASVVRR